MMPVKRQCPSESPPPRGGRKTRHDLGSASWLCGSSGRRRPKSSHRGASGGGVRKMPSSSHVTPTRCASGLARPRKCCPISDGRSKPVAHRPPPSRACGARGRRRTRFKTGPGSRLRLRHSAEESPFWTVSNISQWLPPRPLAGNRPAGLIASTSAMIR